MNGEDLDPRNADPLELGERILELLGEGSFSATYKHAVLLALVDLCLEKLVGSPAGLQYVTVRDVAEKVFSLYWSHTLPYEKDMLRQNNTGQAEILKIISEYRQYAPSGMAVTFEQAKRANPSLWQKYLAKVEWKLIQMPLPRLQTVGNRSGAFLYNRLFSKFRE